MISVFVEGQPRATQTGTVVRAGSRLVPLRRNTPWSALCGLVVQANKADDMPWAGPVSVRLVFIFPLPKSKAARLRGPTTRPDVENCGKGLLDSWNGILYHDDSQIVELATVKLYGPQPGVHVIVDRPSAWWLATTQEAAHRS